MKNVAMLCAVAVLFIAVSAIAAELDGSYTFVSRTKDGAPDLSGWNGTMLIEKGMMSRSYKSKDGKEEKFYEGTMKSEGSDVYAVKFTKAYKSEYVGNEHKNKIMLSGATLTMESTDGKFKEVWTKK